jgi:hypothetical protein
MNENTKSNIVINFLLEVEDPTLDTNVNNANTVHSNTWQSEDSDKYDFLIQDMFLDHFFP